MAMKSNTDKKTVSKKSEKPDTKAASKKASTKSKKASEEDEDGIARYDSDQGRSKRRKHRRRHHKNKRNYYQPTPQPPKQPLRSVVPNNAMRLMGDDNMIHCDSRTLATHVKAHDVTMKPMFVIFYAKWCGFCKKYMKQLINDGGAKKLSQKYTVYAIDSDQMVPLSGKDDVHIPTVTGFPSVFTYTDDTNWRQVQKRDDFKSILSLFP